MRPLRTLLSSLLLLGGGLAFVTAAPASADSWHLSINTGSGWVHDSGAPLFDITRFAPGLSQSSTMQVRNDSPDAADLSLSADNIVELENGCMHSEAVVDTTCGPTQGELGHELIFSVYADPEDDGSYETTPRWTGTLYDLANPVGLLTDLPSAGVVGLRIDMTLPMSSGNETQTDDVDFSFRLTLSGPGSPVPNSPGSPVPSEPGSVATGGSAGTGPSTGPATQTPPGSGSVEVKGVKVTRHKPGLLPHLADELPFTGTPTERIVAGGLWLALAGAFLSLLARRPSRRR